MLRKAKKFSDSVATLTGTMRGAERDDLVKNSVFARFLPKPGNDVKLKQEDGQIFSWRFNQINDARLVLTDELIAEDMRRAAARGETQPEFNEDDAEMTGAEDEE